ncbi:hypothetical protein DENSPDRAFT_886578 [Dentipellis sp. KUC8613]|nr:hypothetical protein DENSPDRAFT_886578 [Dentipellis sp. KUC8613]
MRTCAPSLAAAARPNARLRAAVTSRRAPQRCRLVLPPGPRATITPSRSPSTRALIPPPHAPARPSVSFVPPPSRRHHTHPRALALLPRAPSCRFRARLRSDQAPNSAIARPIAPCRPCALSRRRHASPHAPATRARAAVPWVHATISLPTSQHRPLARPRRPRVPHTAVSRARARDAPLPPCHRPCVPPHHCQIAAPPQNICFEPAQRRHAPQLRRPLTHPDGAVSCPCSAATHPRPAVMRPSAAVALSRRHAVVVRPVPLSHRRRTPLCLDCAPSHCHHPPLPQGAVTPPRSPRSPPPALTPPIAPSRVPRHALAHRSLSRHARRVHPRQPQAPASRREVHRQDVESQGTPFARSLPPSFPHVHSRALALVLVPPSFPLSNAIISHQCQPLISFILSSTSPRVCAPMLTLARYTPTLDTRHLHPRIRAPVRILSLAPLFRTSYWHCALRVTPARQHRLVGSGPSHVRQDLIQPGGLFHLSKY